MRLNVGRCTSEFHKQVSPVNVSSALPLPYLPPPSGQSHGVLYNQMIQKEAFEPVFHIAEQYTLTFYWSRFWEKVPFMWLWRALEIRSSHDKQKFQQSFLWFIDSFIMATSLVISCSEWTRLEDGRQWCLRTAYADRLDLECYRIFLLMCLLKISPLQIKLS